MSFKKGFTLVELAVVLVIIGVLAAIVLVNVGGFTVQGRDTKRIGDLRNFQPLIAQYQLKKGEYPNPTGADVNNVTTGLAKKLEDEKIITSASALPKPPTSNTADVYKYTACQAVTNGPYNHYVLYARLEQDSVAAPQIWTSYSAPVSTWACTNSLTCDNVAGKYDFCTSF